MRGSETYGEAKDLRIIYKRLSTRARQKVGRIRKIVVK